MRVGRFAAAVLALVLVLSFLAVRANAQTHITTTATGWAFAGTFNGCKAVATATEQIGINSGVITSQYGGSNTAWAQAQSARLKNLLGANAVVGTQEDFIYQGQWSSGMIDAQKADLFAHRSWQNNPGSYTLAGNVKDLLDTTGTNVTNQLCGAFSGSQNQADYWDSGGCATPTTNCENAKLFYQHCMTGQCSILQQASNLPMAHTWEYQAEEVDNTAGFNKLTHNDLGYYILAHAPAVKNNSGISEGAPVAHNYTDATLYAKLRAADLLVTEYECSGNATTWSGTGAACCTQAGLPTHPGAVCSPFPAASFAGGVNPFGDAYIGATPAADALSNVSHGLNQAWGLNNSTPCTSSPTTQCNTGYTGWLGATSTLANIASNAYATACSGGTCHGVDTGFVDENGKRISNNSCSLASNVNWATNTQIETDAHTIVADQAYHYVQIVENGFSAAGITGNAHPPWAIEGYNPPTYVLTAWAAAVAASGDTNVLLWLSPGGAVSNGSGLFSSSTASALFQSWFTAIDAGDSSGLPIHLAEFWSGNGATGTLSDDPLTPASLPGDNIGFDVQATRGNTQVQYFQLWLSQKDQNGHYPALAYEHLYTYDNSSQTAGFGWWTSNDNLLDGSASTNVSSATWNTACATNTVYTGPTGCKDSNSNYEGFILTHGGTCTSASSAPSWPPHATASLGLETTNGTCTNIVESVNVVPITETSTQVGASGHAGEYGNSVAGGTAQPLINFFVKNPSWTDANNVVRSGICDPSSAISTTQRVSGGSMF